MRRLRPRSDAGLHLVDGGRVGCTRVGQDVNVALCMACPALQHVEHRDGEVAAIRCRPPATPMGPDAWSGLVPRF
ncbi:hypothetical protein [Egicoccus sp. AB-alg6-2]|uniref:hypothetical protein n=1 Tax=Egicoccus sp. AB-alg6-2 TaxID=3242692 RepID=UPI00359E628D